VAKEDGRGDGQMTLREKAEAFVMSAEGKAKAPDGSRLGAWFDDLLPESLSPANCYSAGYRQALEDVMRRVAAVWASDTQLRDIERIVEDLTK
jgi:DNA-binding FadR family transcriptional regulator